MCGACPRQDRCAQYHGGQQLQWTSYPRKEGGRSFNSVADCVEDGSLSNYVHECGEVISIMHGPCPRQSDAVSGPVR